MAAALGADGDEVLNSLQAGEGRAYVRLMGACWKGINPSAIKEARVTYAQIQGVGRCKFSVRKWNPSMASGELGELSERAVRNAGPGRLSILDQELAYIDKRPWPNERKFLAFMALVEDLRDPDWLPLPHGVGRLKGTPKTGGRTKGTPNKVSRRTPKAELERIMHDTSEPEALRRKAAKIVLLGSEIEPGRPPN